MIEEDQAKYQEEQRRIQNQKLEQEKLFFMSRIQQQSKKELSVVLEEINQMAEKYTYKFLFEKHNKSISFQHWTNEGHSFTQCY